MYMESKKKNLIVAIVAIVVVIGAITTVTSVFGYDLLKTLPFVSVPDSRVPENEKIADCVQGSTTTPCGELESLPTETTSLADSSAPKARNYGALTQIFTNAHFGFRYPEEMILKDEGDVVLSDRENSNLYALKICTPDKPCGGYSSKVSSLEDFEKPIVFDDGLSQIPIENQTYTTANDVKVLRQIYETKQYDPEGTDITRMVCDMCGRSTRYVVFTAEGSFVVFWHITGSEDVTRRLIDSITF